MNKQKENIDEKYIQRRIERMGKIKITNLYHFGIDVKSSCGTKHYHVNTNVMFCDLVKCFNKPLIMDCTKKSSWSKARL